MFGINIIMIHFIALLLLPRVQMRKKTLPREIFMTSFLRA